MKLKNICIKNQTLKALACIVVLASFFIVSCKHKKQQAAPPPQVFWSYPLEHDVDNYLYYIGNTQAYQSVNIVARVQGYLQEVKFPAGGKVSKGQLLFVIEPKIYQDMVDQAKAQLDAANAQWELAKATYQKNVQAAKSNAVSEIEVLEAKAKMDEAKANVEVCEAQLNTAKQNLSYAYVTSPCEGKISRNLIDRGNLVGTSGSNAMLATVVDDNPMFVYFNIEDSWLIANFHEFKDMKDQVKEDVLADDAGYIFIALDDDFDFKFKAKLDYMDPTVDLSSGTITVRAETENPDGEIPSGLIVKVKLPTTKMKNALLIPEYAVCTDQSGNYVWTLSDSSTVHKTNITTGGLYFNTFRAITEKLNKTDKIIVTGIQRVKEGMKVSPVEQKINSPFVTAKD